MPSSDPTDRTLLLFGALADATRLRILRRLAVGDAAVGELATELELSQPTVSHHLGTLLAAGLARATRQGRRRLLSLPPLPGDPLVAKVLELALGPGVGSRPRPSGRARPAAAESLEDHLL